MVKTKTQYAPASLARTELIMQGKAKTLLGFSLPTSKLSKKKKGNKGIPEEEEDMCRIERQAL